MEIYSIIIIILLVLLVLGGFLGRLSRLRLLRYMQGKYPKVTEKYRLSQLWFIYWWLPFLRLRLLRDKHYKSDPALKEKLIKSFIYDSIVLLGIIILIGLIIYLRFTY